MTSAELAWTPARLAWGPGPQSGLPPPPFAGFPNDPGGLANVP